LRRGPPTEHYLLPYERYAAARLLRAQEAHAGSPRVVQFREQLGPEGITLFAATIGAGLTACLLGAAGALVILVTAAAARGSVVGLVVAYVFLSLSLANGLLSVLRIKQRRRAVRRFLSSRQGR
jgi:hypothetical protein